MKKYTEVQGDLLQLASKGDFDVIAHGCNCFQLMGAGIALHIRRNLPQAYGVDVMDTRNPINRLGDMTISHLIVKAIDERVPKLEDTVKTKEVAILNLYTQYHPGCRFDYKAFTLCLRKVNMLYPDKVIGLPKIGCGIGGGHWPSVEKIIKEELRDMEVVIVHYQL